MPVTAQNTILFQIDFLVLMLSLLSAIVIIHHENMPI